MPLATTPVSPFLEDSSGYHGEAERVVVPADVSEVREVVRACSAQRIPLTIAGAGTGLTGARVPHGGWVISLERFRRLEIGSGRARCGAYITLSELAAEAGKSRQFLGPNPTETSASVGGVIATNAGGARSFHYGALRRHVLALEVTFMDGRTVELKRGDRVDFPVPSIAIPRTTKNSAGYYMHPDVEWVDLLAGSEGTLGIVTEAELQLLPEPPAMLSGVVFFPTDEGALNASDAWRPVSELRLLEYIDAAGLDLLRRLYPELPSSARAALLIEQNLASETDAEVDRWAERLSQAGAMEEESWFGFAASDRERFRKLRHALPAMIVDQVRRNGYPKFGTDFAVPIDRHRELHAYYQQRCAEVLPGQYTIFGHIGDANNHVNLLPATADQAKRGEEMIYDFARYTVSLGGTIAAEHGVGKSKADLLPIMYAKADIEAMCEVKRRLDPHWLLGRGTLFGSRSY
jgi:FAD/FMN-containing dehydrogenase